MPGIDSLRWLFGASCRQIEGRSRVAQVDFGIPIPDYEIETGGGRGTGPGRTGRNQHILFAGAGLHRV